MNRRHMFIVPTVYACLFHIIKLYPCYFVLHTVHLRTNKQILIILLNSTTWQESHKSLKNTEKNWLFKERKKLWAQKFKKTKAISHPQPVLNLNAKKNIIYKETDLLRCSNSQSSLANVSRWSSQAAFFTNIQS